MRIVRHLALAALLLLIVASPAANANPEHPLAATPIVVNPWQPETGSDLLADGTSVLPGEEALSRLAVDGSVYAGVSSAGDYDAADNVFLVANVVGPHGVIEMIPYVTVALNANDPLLKEKVAAAYLLAERRGYTSMQRGDLVNGKFVLR